MSGPIFVALVNPKSGGNLGHQLLSRFKEILKHDRVYNLADDEHPGPAKALEDHKNEENLRLIGMLFFFFNPLLSETAFERVNPMYETFE